MLSMTIFKVACICINNSYDGEMNHEVIGLNDDEKKKSK